MITIESKNKEWLSHSNSIFSRTQNRTQRCQAMLLDIQKTIEAYDEAVVKSRNETEHSLQVNIEDIQFRIAEILNVKAALEDEITNLTLYRKRTGDFYKFLENEALQIVRKCLAIRQNRQCVDLYRDNVDQELTAECSLLEDIISLADNLQQQAGEHVRHLKQLVFTLNKDLRDKDTSVNLDVSNSQLRQESLLLSLDTRKLPIDTRKFTHEENTYATKAALRASNQKLLTCRHFRSLVDFLLKQTVDHLRHQKELTTQSMNRKVEEYQEAKIKLENQHCETLRSMSDLNNTIADLEKAIQDKKGYILLAHSRLGNRAQRPGLELVRDDVDVRLEREIEQLQASTTHLHSLLAEAKTSARNMAKIQHELEENINIKSNSLKLDQVDCTVVRLGLNYNVY